MGERKRNERVNDAFTDLLTRKFSRPKDINEWYTEHGGDPEQLRVWRSGRVIISQENWNTKFSNWLLDDFGEQTEFRNAVLQTQRVIDDEREKSTAAQRRGKSLAPAVAPTKPDHSARGITFWHTFQEREHDEKGVRDLIATAGRRVVVTGGSLDQCVWRFRNEIRLALDRGVLVALVMGDPHSEHAIRLYRRYADRFLTRPSLIESRYRTFYRSLASAERQRFSFSYTDLSLTHSLGLYDDQIFLSEFCLDRHAEECPSYRVAPDCHSYGVFFYEIHTILLESHNRLGRGKQKLLKTVADSAKSIRSYKP